MTVALLVDNDIVIKLARMDAFSDTMSSIGVTGKAKIGSIRVMLRYMGRSSEERRLRLVANRQEAERLNQVLQSIEEIELTDAEALTAAKLMKTAIENGLDLQEGELMLAVVAVARGGIDLATGDKRAVRSLPHMEQRWPNLSVLRTRVICLEQMFKSLCKLRGLPRVRQALATSPNADATIQFVFEQCAAHGADRFMAGLEFVTNEQIRKPAPGWLKDPL